MQKNRSEGMDVSAFFGALRRRVLVIVAAVVVGAGVAYLVSSGQESKYEASAKLLLRGAPANPQGQVFGGELPETAPDREDLVTRNEITAATRRQLARR